MFTGLYHKGVIRLIFSTKYRRTPLTIYIYIFIMDIKFWDFLTEDFSKNKGEKV